jgi:hypothetical protein
VHANDNVFLKQRHRGRGTTGTNQLILIIYWY